MRQRRPGQPAHRPGRGLHFLERDGFRVYAEEAAAMRVLLDLAAGKLDQKPPAAWLDNDASAQ